MITPQDTITLGGRGEVVQPEFRLSGDHEGLPLSTLRDEQAAHRTVLFALEGHNEVHVHYNCHIALTVLSDIVITYRMRGGAVVMSAQYFDCWVTGEGECDCCPCEVAEAPIREAENLWPLFKTEVERAIL